MDEGNGSGRTGILTLCAPGWIAQGVPQILIYSCTLVKTGSQCTLEQPLCKDGHFITSIILIAVLCMIFTFNVAEVFDQSEC